MEAMEVDPLVSINFSDLNKDDDQYFQISTQLAKDVLARKLTIVEVIEKLRDLLLSQSYEQRDVGVSALSGIINRIPDGFFSVEEIMVLSAYFTEKIKDHHQVAKSALQGVLPLINYSNIPNDSIVQLISSIFNNITCQQQQQTDRNLIFQIFETALRQHPTDINSMGIDFVYGVISSIDSERDPKNLKFLFNWLPTFLNQCKLGHLSEEMFDVLSSYFPVDFKAPPSSNLNITREDLAHGLANCLTAISEFGVPAIELVLEKLDSSLTIAQKDSLEILRLGCQHFEAVAYYEHCVQLWSNLQNNILKTSDSALKTDYLNTLRAIMTKISTGDDDGFTNIILDITDTLKGNVLPGNKFHLESVQILIHIARASQQSAVLVAKSVAPLLENTYKIETSPKNKVEILWSLIQLVRAVIETNPDVDLNSVEEIVGCPSLCCQALLSDNNELIIEGFKGLTELTRYIPENVRKVYLQLLKQFTTRLLDSNVKDAMIKAFCEIALQFPKDVDESVLSKDELLNLDTIDQYLGSIKRLVIIKHFEDYTVQTLIGYTLKEPTSSIALKHLLDVILYDGLITNLEKKKFLIQLLEFLEKSTYNWEINYLQSINEVIQNIVRFKDAAAQTEVYRSTLKITFKNPAILATVLNSLILPLRGGVLQDYSLVDRCLSVLETNDDEETINRNYLEILASIFNKLNDDKILEAQLNQAQEQLEKLSQDTRIWLVSWVASALAYRNYHRAWDWIDLLIEYSSSNALTAKGFKILTRESSKIISNKNYCNIMNLHKQKIFVYCTNKINNIPDCNATQLNIIGYLIEAAPSLAVVGQFGKIFRLIIACLERNQEPTILEALIHRLTDFMTNQEKIIEEHLEDILTRILDLTTFQAAMSVRLASIRFLHRTCSTYKVYQLLPLKQRVIERLGLCVDDNKRLVRREAMECRAAWFLLDAPL